MTRAQLFRRWGRWAFVLAIFALGIPLSTALLVRSSSSRARLHDLASTAIREELGMNATIGTVQLQLVPFSIVARDITLRDPVYGRFADAEELRIRPSFRALLRGAIDLNAIEIRGADLRLVIRNGQVRNLPRAEGPPGGDGPILPFDELRVVDSTLTVDAEPDASGQLRDVDLLLTEEDRVISIEVESGSGWARHRGGRERLEHLEGAVEIAPDELRISHLTLETPVLRVAARDARAPLPFRDRGYSGHVEVRYDLAHIARLPLPEEVTLPVMAGEVEVSADLTTRGQEQRARGTVELAGVRIEQYGIGESGSLRFTADRHQVRILPGSVVQNLSGGGHVGVTASISLDPDRGFPIDATARVHDFSFARLMGMLGVSDNAIVEWIFNGQLRLRGTLDPLNLVGPVHTQTRDFIVSHGGYREQPARRIISVSHGDFDGRWSIRPDGVRFSNLVGVLPSSRLRGDVLLGFDNTLRVRAHAEHADLADIAPLDHWPLAGVGSANVTIEGTFQDPHVTGHLAFEDFLFDDFRLGSVESDALLDPDGLGVHFAMVSAVKNESRYRAEDLYLDFHDNRFAMTGLLHLDGLLLEDFYHVFGLEEDQRYAPYQGLAHGQAAIRYTNGHPGDAPSGTLDVEMNLGFGWANLDGYAFDSGEMVGHFRWLDWDRGMNGAELAISHMSLAKGDGTVTVDGRMALGGVLDMTAVADRIALRDLEGIGDRLPDLDGVATAIGRVGGTVDVMHADFDVGLTNLTYGGRALGDGRFFVRQTDRDDPWVSVARTWTEIPDEPCARGRIGLANADWPADPPLQTVDGPMERLERPMAFVVCGSALDGELVVDLAVGRTEPLPVRGIIELAGLDLSPMLPQTPDGRRMDGTVTGTITLTDGALELPETIQANVTLAEVRVGQDDLEVWNAEPLELDLKDGIIAVNRAVFAGPESDLRVRGFASLEDGLALQANGEIDLGLVARLTRTVTEARGRVGARLSITGPFADPEFYGTADVSNAAFRFASFETGIENLSGRIEFSSRSVIFDGFAADVADGRIRLSGAAELRDLEIERYQFDVSAEDVRYAFGEGVDTAFGGEGSLVWSRGDRLPMFRGELAVDRFEYSRPIELRSLGDVAARAVRGAFRSSRTEVRRYDPEQDMVQLDVRVTQDAPFRVRNTLVDAELRIEDTERPFRIVGTDQRYGVQGAMEITRGAIHFQNNEFVVRRGVLRFDDTTEIEPHVDVEAVTEIRRSSDLSAPNWRIFLSVMGASDNLRLSTRSEPDLAEDDILMLLAFGMTRSELQQMQAGDLVGAAAIETLSSVMGVDREVRRALPVIDEFRVTTGYSTRTGRSEPRIAVGRRLADRVRATAQAGIGDGREFRAGVDVQLDDNTHAEVSYDNYNVNGANSFGNLGLDVGFRLEFE